MNHFSLVLPCYNEGESLRTIVSRATACALRRNLGPSEFQLILVNNGSTDESAEVLKALQTGPLGAFLSIVSVEVNQGYGHGILQGLKAARSTYTAWTHADEQCDPEDAFRALDRLERLEGPWVIKGRRRGRRLSAWAFSRCFELVAWTILGRRCFEANAQPKVFSTDLIPHLTAPYDPPKGFAFDLYVLLRAQECGYRIAEVPVSFPPRRHGLSRWSATLFSRWRTIRGLITFMLAYRDRSAGWRSRDGSDKFPANAIGPEQTLQH